MSGIGLEIVCVGREPLRRAELQGVGGRCAVTVVTLLRDRSEIPHNTKSFLILRDFLDLNASLQKLNTLSFCHIKKTPPLSASYRKAVSLSEPTAAGMNMEHCEPS